MRTRMLLVLPAVLALGAVACESESAPAPDPVVEAPDVDPAASSTHRTVTEAPAVTVPDAPPVTAPAPPPPPVVAPPATAHRPPAPAALPPPERNASVDTGVHHAPAPVAPARGVGGLVDRVAPLP